MSDALSFAEIDGQYVELLPARTVLSLFGNHPGGDASGTGTGGAGGTGISVINAAVSIASSGDTTATGADASGGAGHGLGGDASGGDEKFDVEKGGH